MTEQFEIDSVPNNPEAEQALVTSCLIEDRYFDMVELPPEAFYTHRWRMIWIAMQSVRAHGLDINVTTVMSDLKMSNHLDEIGGANTFVDAMRDATSYEDVKSYEQLVRDSYIRRQQVEIAGELATQAYKGKVDISSIIERLTSYSNGERDGRLIGAGLDDLDVFIRERIENPSDVWGVPTGFPDLDYRGGGLQWQRVMLLSGESGLGKTTLALQFCLHAAKKGFGVLIFETEMPEQATLIRLAELECGLPYRAVMSGRVTKEQLELWNVTKRKIEKLPIYINDDPAISTADMRRIINRVRVEHFDVDLVMLDYLGNLADEAEYGKGDHDQTRAKRLRTITRYCEVATVAIQDMNKSGNDELTSISGGAKVRYSADDAYIIVQDETDPVIHYLKPVKERYGDQVKKVVALRRPGLGFESANVKTFDTKSMEYVH